MLREDRDPPEGEETLRERPSGRPLAESPEALADERRRRGDELDDRDRARGRRVR